MNSIVLLKMKMQQREYLDQWRALQPVETRHCANRKCGREFKTQFGHYCSAACKSAEWKARQRDLQLERLGDDGRCRWCSTELENPLKRKFCSDSHKSRFFAAKQAGKPIRVQVEPGLVIETRQYDRIEEVRREWRAKRERPYLESGRGRSEK